MLSPEEQDRYSRHTLLKEVGDHGQLKLKNAHVLIIGLGGLGCPAAQYLAAAGVGTIGLCDGDTVSLSNLQRQILFTTDDIGKSKTVTAKTQLQKLNPHLKVHSHPYHLTTENAADTFKPYDIIVDGTDNFPTRFLISDEATSQSKPVIYGAIHQFEGQLSVFAPHLPSANNVKGKSTAAENLEGKPSAASPCLRCMIPELPPQGAVPT